jgi:hypothetical protein
MNKDSKRKKINTRKSNNTLNKTQKKSNINNSYNLYNLYTSLGNINKHIMQYNENYDEKNADVLKKMKEYANEKQERFFYITTPNNYMFNTIEQIFTNVIEIKFFMTDYNNANDICVKITIPRDKRSKIGNIDTLYYDKECSISKIKLKEKEGTIEMLKTALQYTIDTYPYIRTFTIQDETHYNDSSLNKPHITAKRLLLGRPGWYEEYFGAEPEKKTLELIKNINTKRQIINTIIKNIKPQDSGDEWWTTENILKIINNIPKDIVKKHVYYIEKNIFGTGWFIRKNTIKEYNMSYNIQMIDNIEVNENYYKNYTNIQHRNGV